MKHLLLITSSIVFFALACSNDTVPTTQPIVENTATTTPIPPEVATIEDSNANEVKAPAVVENANNNSLPELPPPSNTTTNKSATASKKPIEVPNPISSVSDPIPAKDVTISEDNNTADISVSTPVINEPPVCDKPDDIKPMRPTLSHDILNDLLSKYVDKTGQVDYAGLQAQKRSLESYLKILESNAPDKSWSKNKEMAYWINLYNAFTIKTILDHYPVKSIMDIDKGKVWDTRKINIGGKYYTLNMIEKEMLLKRFKEPRVHFAVNCAAASCPPLLNKAWTEDNVQRYFEIQAKAFINNPKYNTVSSKNIVASQIFNWYAGDFGGSDKIVSYFQKYAATTIKDNAKISFGEYNWNLNKK